MKGSVVLILISLSLAVSVALQSRKADSTRDDIDRLRDGIAGARPYIQQGGTLSFSTEAADYTLYMQARYLLAPCVMNYVKEAVPADTLLAVQYIYSGDSTLSETIAARRLLWQHEDDRYRYTLTTTN